jgi:hypothetical protein
MAIPPIPSTPFTPHAYSQDYWVDPVNGNDNNLGTSIETPFATITQAVTVVGSGSANINLATGTYNESTITLTQGVFNFTAIASNGLFGTTNLPTFNMYFVFNGSGVTTFDGCCFNGNLFLNSGDGVNLNNCSNGGINVTTSSVVLCCNACNMIGVEFTIGFDAFFLNQTWTDSIVINAGGVIIQSSTYCSPLTLNGGDLIVLETVITSQSPGSPAVIQTGGTLFLGDVQCYDINEALTGVTLAGGTYSFQNVDLNNSLSTISSTNIGNTTWFDAISTIAPLPTYQYTNDYWVDPVNGSDTNTGLSINTPFQTFTKALTVLANIPTGNIYLMSGAYNESDIDIHLNGNYFNVIAYGSSAYNGGTQGSVSLNMGVEVRGPYNATWTGIYFVKNVCALFNYNQCTFGSTISPGPNGSTGSFNNCYFQGDIDWTTSHVIATNCTCGAITITFDGLSSGSQLSNCDFSSATSITSNCTLTFNSCLLNAVTLNNAEMVLNSCSYVSWAAINGTSYVYSNNCTFYATSPGGIAITTSGEGATVYLNNTTCYDTNVALTIISIITGDSYSFNDFQYLTTGSTLTGTNLGYVSYFDAISTIAPLPSYQYTYDYWVDPVNGSDSNTGLSINTPFQTFTNTLNVITALSVPSSIVANIFLMSGQYNESDYSGGLHNNSYVNVIGNGAAGNDPGASSTVQLNMAISLTSDGDIVWSGIAFNGDVFAQQTYVQCVFLSTINTANNPGCTGTFTDCYFGGDINFGDANPFVFNNCQCGTIVFDFNGLNPGSQINNCDFSNCSSMIIQGGTEYITFNNSLLNGVATYSSVIANFNSCQSIIFTEIDDSSVVHINNSILYATTSGGNALPAVPGQSITAYLDDVTCLDSDKALTVLTMPDASYSFQGVRYLQTGSTLGTNLNITSSFDAVSLVGGWTVQSSGTKLYFSNGGTNLMSLDTSGNIIALGTITPLSTP